MNVNDPSALRRAFGAFMTGVTVVTARDKVGNPVGFTANSFSSVSLDPPLLLVCPAKSLSSFEVFDQCGAFAVNVLAEGQESISTVFASFKGDRFADLNWENDTLGLPKLADTAAHFACKRWNQVDAGDHIILVGEVMEANLSGRPGLGYANGSYFNLSLERQATTSPQNGAIVGAIINHNGSILLEETKEGLRPPSLELESRRNVRTALADDLKCRGLTVDLGAAYSIFNVRSSGLQHIYFKGQAKSADTFANCKYYEIETLKSQSFIDEAHQSMLTRYAEEYHSHSFGLYVGDESGGDVSKY